MNNSQSISSRGKKLEPRRVFTPEGPRVVGFGVELVCSEERRQGRAEVNYHHWRFAV